MSGCEKNQSLLSVTATGGLLLLALYDSFLLATVLAAALGWAWYKHHSCPSPAPSESQKQGREKQSYQPEKPESLDSYQIPKVEPIIPSSKPEPEPEEDFLEDEAEFDEALEKSNVELIGSIQSFEPESLKPVKTQEPLSGVELVKKEMVLSNVRDEVEQFDVDSLKKTDVEERAWIPDQETINQEKVKVDHLSGIENFDTDRLAKVKTPEPLTGADLLKNELMQKALGDDIEKFNIDAMKHVEVEEKIVLPDPETLEQEKSRHNLLTGLEEFNKDSLSHVQTLEPMTGTDLLQQELSLKSLNQDLSSFDSNSLKSSNTEEKNILPDAETLKSEKEHYNFLKELESGHDLSPTVSKEPMSGVDLMKQELTHSQVLENVTGFDRDLLKGVELEEKSWLPDNDTIQSEKSHMEHLSSIASFDQAALSKVKVSEPLTGVELAKQETYRTSISDELVSFDKSELKPTETVEKISLPDDEIISSERQHHEFLTGLQAGVELKPTETREPLNPLDLAKLETSKEQVEEEIQAFDRARLTPVVTEEKQFLPSAEDIKTEALHKELDSLDTAQEQEAGGVAGLRDFLTKDKETDSSSSTPEEITASGPGAAGLKNLLEREARERSSSGESWEKVSNTAEDMSGLQTSSDC